MQSLLVRLGTALAYLFIAAIIYLAGIYVAPLFYFLYLLVLAIPVLSFLQVLLTVIALHYSQDFDTEHPVKGQSIGYRLNVTNETVIASSIVRIRFKAVHPDLSTQLEDLSTVFRGRSSLQNSYSVSCPYRGIYTVGLRSLEVTDLLGWVRIKRPVYHRTFYVYPRVIPLQPRFAGGRSYGLSGNSRSGKNEDSALLEGLNEYRSGLPVRQMAWKRFFETGTPFLRRVGTSAEPGIVLYLDLRRERYPDAAELEAEDCSVEIAVSLVKCFLDRSIPVTLKAMGRELFLFKGSDPDDFQSFYHGTINLVFQRTVSPASVYQSDRKQAATGGEVLFISHLPAPEIVELIGADSEASISAIFNLRSMSMESRTRLRSYRENAGQDDHRLLLVDGPESIKEDLEG